MRGKQVNLKLTVKDYCTGGRCRFQASVRGNTVAFLADDGTWPHLTEAQVIRLQDFLERARREIWAREGPTFDDYGPASRPLPANDLRQRRG